MRVIICALSFWIASFSFFQTAALSEQFSEVPSLEELEDALNKSPGQSAVVTRGMEVVAAENGQKTSLVEENLVGFPISFELNSAEIREESLPFLDVISRYLKKNSQKRILIEGHTDASGGQATNLSLSKNRAHTVYTILVYKYQIDQSRLETVGFGEDRPLADISPFDAANRRVQFKVIP